MEHLPIVEPEDYHVDSDGPHGRWRTGHLHWLPVGADRGNGGRIKLAGQPINPIAERLVNGMEAIIELERLREVAKNPSAPCPTSPRDAVLRYFGLPRLDAIPRTSTSEARRALLDKVDLVRKRLHVHLNFSKKAREFAVSIRDLGMGQTPSRIHQTLLSLGRTDKADKPYMIGVFGQGGSSAYAASAFSVIYSRRAPELLPPKELSELGYTIVRQIFPRNRRDPYFAYLAARSDGAVPSVNAAIADEMDLPHGTCFTHIKYDFGGSGSAVARVLYQALNHVLFNPILPYDLFTLEKDRPELMQGTGQRLARKTAQLGRQLTLDRAYEAQNVVPPARGASDAG
jgi:hypothetical protein